MVHNYMNFQGQNGGRGGNNNRNNNGNNNRNWNRNDKSATQIGPRDGCFVCGGNHYVARWPQRSAARNGPRVQHQIHATVDHRQAEFQEAPLQLTRKLYNCEVSILIDTSAIESFVDPSGVAKIPIKVGYMEKPQIVEYGNQTEHQVEQYLSYSELELPTFHTQVNLYVAPLGSYDVILGINWLTEHKAIVNCEDKLVDYLDDFGNPIVVNRIKRSIMLRHISAMQLKKDKRGRVVSFLLHM